jgi:pimeloyl-ACP methyl ester carboxylesterase
MAVRHPEIVERLLLLSAVGPVSWPAPWARVAARFIFSPVSERATWAAARVLVRLSPRVGLAMLLSGLSTLPMRRLVRDVDLQHRVRLAKVLGESRSGRGLANDLRPVQDVCDGVRQPTLVVATQHDGSVPFSHAQKLATGIAHASLLESRAQTHFIWCAPDWPHIAAAVGVFLAQGIECIR